MRDQVDCLPTESVRHGRRQHGAQTLSDHRHRLRELCQRCIVTDKVKLQQNQTNQVILEQVKKYSPVNWSTSVTKVASFGVE